MLLKRIRQIFVLLLVNSLLVHHTYSDSRIKEQPGWDNAGDEKFIASQLMDWIYQHHAFQYQPDSVPAIKYVTEEKLIEMALGNDFSNKINTYHEVKIKGLYDFIEKVVYLTESTDLATLENKGVLLHELVHFLQYENGYEKTVACKNKLEALAYRLEKKFLDSQGQDHSINTAHIHQLSQC